MLIRELIARCARTCGDDTAYVDGDRRLTWRAIDTRSDGLAATLQRRGVRPGDTSAILSQDRLEVVEHWFACLKIGVPVEAPCRPLLAEALGGPAERGALVVGFGEAAAANEGLVAEGGPFDPHTPAGADPVALACTAGTAGLPKGGMREGMTWLCVNVGLRHEDRWLSAHPAR